MAKELAAFSNEKFDAKVEILLNVGGKVNQIVISNEYESLAAMEELTVRALQDPEVLEMLKKWDDSGLFVGSSMVNQYFKSAD